jgi:hypothetical protein
LAVHATHTPSASGVHALRYCPVAQGVSVHARHALPFLKKPGLHCQPQLFAS